MSAVDRLAPDAAVTPAAPRPVVNRRESPILPPRLRDEDVFDCWLAAKATGRGRVASTALAQYRTEAERLFWYARQAGAPISSWGLTSFPPTLPSFRRRPRGRSASLMYGAARPTGDLFSGR